MFGEERREGTTNLELIVITLLGSHRKKIKAQTHQHSSSSESCVLSEGKKKMTRKRTPTTKKDAKDPSEDFKGELVSPSDISDDDIQKKKNDDRNTITTASPSKESTLQKILTRTILGFCMTGYYLSMLRGGHMYCILTGVLTQVELFRELVNVRYRTAQEKEVPLFRTIQWVWFFLAMSYICKLLFPHPSLSNPLPPSFSLTSPHEQMEKAFIAFVQKINLSFTLLKSLNILMLSSSPVTVFSSSSVRTCANVPLPAPHSLPLSPPISGLNSQARNYEISTESTHVDDRDCLCCCRTM
jgi:hypothetical protein